MSSHISSFSTCRFLHYRFYPFLTYHDLLPSVAFVRFCSASHLTTILITILLMFFWGLDLRWMMRVASMTNHSILNEEPHLEPQDWWHSLRILNALDLSCLYCVSSLAKYHYSCKVCHVIPDHLPLCAESEELEITVVYWLAVAFCSSVVYLTDELSLINIQQVGQRCVWMQLRQKINLQPSHEQHIPSPQRCTWWMGIELWLIALQTCCLAWWRA